jgi:hypothetical protein
MAEETVFRGVIEFLNELGIYDVVLPFLLVFTIVFAILEKTRILGIEEIEGKKYTKKNLDALVSFVVAFLVVASTKLVAIINKALANIVLLILLAVFFLLLVGSFSKEGEREFLAGGWKTVFMIIMFIGIIFIFLDALDWLSPFWKFLTRHWETRWVASLILIIAIILFIIYITRGEKAPAKTAE